MLPNGMTKFDCLGVREVVPLLVGRVILILQALVALYGALDLDAADPQLELGAEPAEIPLVYLGKRGSLTWLLP